MRNVKARGVEREGRASYRALLVGRSWVGVLGATSMRMPCLPLNQFKDRAGAAADDADRSRPDSGPTLRDRHEASAVSIHCRCTREVRMLSPDDLRLIARLQGDLPLTDRPFADVAAELGWNEDRVIERLRRLMAANVLVRLGPLFRAGPAGRFFVLAATAVPPERFDAVAAQLERLPEVVHCCRRDHRLDMWFVVAAGTPEETAHALRHIETATGLAVIDFPEEAAYGVDPGPPLEASVDEEVRDAAR
jgi:DNA-binding Lrp family transcriptional regulator